ncbi:MAG: hypothetical protein P4L33_16745 [Capsulimonadaceae bacterium]|nr:hypothetical protein [Capsulimonadaceae bacterium]
MLIIDLDVPDVYVSVPGFSLNGSVDRLPLSSNGTINEGCWRTPDGSALLIQPYQLMDDWASRTKFTLADYSDLSSANGGQPNWEQVARRASTDYFLQSLGQVSGGVITQHFFPRNAGFFVEAWLYAPADQRVYDLFDMTFGGYFSLFLHSDGNADLFDVRSPGAPVASGNLSGGAPVSGKFVQILVLPFRRQCLLIWSNLGGYFVANVGGTLDADVNTADKGPDTGGVYVITEAAAVSLYNTCTPPSATFSLSVLQYPAEAMLTTQSYPSSYPILKQPALTIAQADQEMGTSIALAPLTTIDPSSPPVTYRYLITLRSANGSEGYGDLAGSPAVFGKFYSPMDYLNRIDARRELANRTALKTTIVLATSAEMHLDKDRGKSVFKFTLDNPDGIWKSLKDAQNLRISAYLDLPSNHPEAAQGFGGRLTDETDPDRAIVAANQGPVTIFDGFTERIDFADGQCSAVDVSCAGLSKKLRHCILSSQRDWDNTAHTEVVRNILMAAGLVDASDFAGGTALNVSRAEISIYNDGINAPLPPATVGSEPAWRPRDGTTAEEFLNEIVNWSGWDLFEYGGVFYYMPKDFEISSLMWQYGVPIVHLSNTSLSHLGGTTLQSEPNCSVSGLAALADPPVRQFTEELVANDIFVVGMDDQGNSLTAHYVATALMTDRSNPFYVGDRWIYTLLDASLTTQDAVVAACANLAARLTKPTRKIEFALPDYRREFLINSPCYLEAYGNSLVTAISASFGALDGSTGDRARTTQYMVELV